MGYINEEVTCDEFPATLTVVERAEGETREPWRFIEVEFDRFERLTPPELRRLGRWLVQEGRRLGKEYKSNGAKRDLA